MSLQKPLHNINNFLSGHWNYLNRDKIPQHYREQAEYRALLCAPCTLSKSCLKCGCAIPQLFYAPLKEDADKKWGKYLSYEKWENFKQEILATRTSGKSETVLNFFNDLSKKRSSN